jgi:probable O-glycosylation ligase (exosortase A-associated)
MRDFGLLVSLAALACVALWRPWLGVIGLAFVGYLQPHTYAGDFARNLPIYKILFAATVIGTLFTRDRQLPPRDWRVLVLVGLWLFFLLTTTFSWLPFLAWPKFVEVSAVLASTFLVLVLINTREKLFILIAAIALAFGLVSLKGGFWAIIHGFADRVYGPPNSQYGDNNHFAVAAVMTIPLLLLWFRQSTPPWLKAALALAIVLSVLAALSSWSRGALLALGVNSILLLIDSRKGAWALAPVVGAVVLALLLLPDQWFARMETIGAYQDDGSARGRLAVWQQGLGYALNSPFLGAGFEGWVVGRTGNDWHSAYVEIMAEHGLLAFLLWISLVLGTLVRLTQLAWRHRGSAESAWIRHHSSALRASLVAYCVGGAFVGIAYWDLLYQLIAAAIVLEALSDRLVSRTLEPAPGGDRSVAPAARPWMTTSPAQRGSGG